MVARPFDGVRVLDLSRTFAGALAAMHIADFGGDVVRVEAHRADVRDADPQRLYGQRNKTILDGPLGEAELRRLLGAADVVVVDGPQDELRRAGFDAPTLRRSEEHTS